MVLLSAASRRCTVPFAAVTCAMMNALINAANAGCRCSRGPLSSARLTLLQPAFVQVEQQDEEPKSGGRVLPILPFGPQVEAGPPVVLDWY